MLKSTNFIYYIFISALILLGCSHAEEVTQVEKEIYLAVIRSPEWYWATEICDEFPLSMQSAKIHVRAKMNIDAKLEGRIEEISKERNLGFNEVVSIVNKQSRRYRLEVWGSNHANLKRR